VKPIDLPEIRALIARHKRYDALFGVLGLIALSALLLPLGIVNVIVTGIILLAVQG